MIITFCGHRKIEQAERISKWLDMLLPSLIEGGADVFYLGGYAQFDIMAASAVKRQKAVYPKIASVLVLPYLHRNFDLSFYDSTTYPPLERVPPGFAIIRRNEWMVSASDVVISGVTHDDSGGAAKTLHFARRKHKVIFQYPTHAGSPSSQESFPRN